MSMHIALTFDDNFWAPAFATMRSVCLFTPKREELVFHLCHRTLTPEHKADLEAIRDEFPVTLVWHALDQMDMFTDIAARMPESERFPSIVYARLLIDRLVGDGVDRVLYLDCDTMVRDDVKRLFDLDLEGNAIAAVRDISGAHITSGRDMRKNRDIFDPADYYFNSGVMLIDVRRWREARIIEKMEELHQAGIMQRIYYDQDLLNLTFKGQWLSLSWRWNTIDSVPAHESLNPAIIHYTGDNSPWHLLSTMRPSVAFARLYRHTMTNALYYRFARHRWKRWWLKKLRLAR